jgi:hypothetical protein
MRRHGIYAVTIKAPMDVVPRRRCTYALASVDQAASQPSEMSPATIAPTFTGSRRTTCRNDSVSGRDSLGPLCAPTGAETSRAFALAKAPLSWSKSITLRRSPLRTHLHRNSFRFCARTGSAGGHGVCVFFSQRRVSPRHAPCQEPHEPTLKTTSSTARKALALQSSGSCAHCTRPPAGGVGAGTISAVLSSLRRGAGRRALARLRARTALRGLGRMG